MESRKHEHGLAHLLSEYAAVKHGMQADSKRAIKMICIAGAAVIMSWAALAVFFDLVLGMTAGSSLIASAIMIFALAVIGTALASTKTRTW